MDQIHPISGAINGAVLLSPPDAIDQRLACMALVAADLVLVEHGELSLDDAWDQHVADVEDVLDIDFIRRARPRRPAHQPRPTPQTTIEAVMLDVREHGLTALKTQPVRERLSRCDSAARQQINERIARLFPGANI